MRWSMDNPRQGLLLREAKDDFSTEKILNAQDAQPE